MSCRACQTCRRAKYHRQMDTARAGTAFLDVPRTCYRMFSVSRHHGGSLPCSPSPPPAQPKLHLFPLSPTTPLRCSPSSFSTSRRWQRRLLRPCPISQFSNLIASISSNSLDVHSKLHQSLCQAFYQTFDLQSNLHRPQLPDSTSSPAMCAAVFLG